jgi:hypothetical protein
MKDGVTNNDTMVLHLLYFLSISLCNDGVNLGQKRNWHHIKKQLNAFELSIHVCGRAVKTLLE